MGAILVPGSYDPVTLGHLAVIRQAAAIADTVYAAIFVNPKKQYRFSLEARLALLREACRDFPNVIVTHDEGMLCDYAKRMNISLILKGFRNDADLAYEREMAEYNLAHSGVATALLPSPPELAEISSTEVRRRLDAGLPLDGFLPPSVLPLLPSRK